MPLEQVAAAMGELGWSHRDGTPVASYEIGWLAVFTTLDNVTRERRGHEERRWISPEAAALARAALRR